MAASSEFKHNLFVRAITGIILISVLLTTLILGKYWWRVFASISALLSLGEFYHMAYGTYGFPRIIGYLGGLSILLQPNLTVSWSVCFTLTICSFISCAIEIFRRERSGESFSCRSAGTVLVGLITIVLPWDFLIQLRDEALGLPALLSVFLCTWNCDVFAYLVGSRWGKRHICPHVSPNKSLEGFIGGLLASLLCGVACALYWRSKPLPFAIVGLVCGTLGQIGDLIESVFKREFGIKDSSHLLPGHGGFFDRFDSILINGTMCFMLWEVLI